MPTSSDIAITIGGVDVTNKVLYSSARFDSQLGAVPGSCDLTIKDPDQTLDFTTGDEITLDIDGQRQWGGFVISATRTFAFPVVDTTAPAQVRSRQWKIGGLDYNLLFDKRVLRNPANYLTALPTFALDRTMGDLLRNELFANYVDIAGDGLDTTTFVDNTFVPRFDANGNPAPDANATGSFPQQGSYLRAAMDDFAQFGTVYYIDASKNVHFHEVEDTAAAWGFSDVPNNLALPNAAARYGMRELEEYETAEAMANDALVWGGSEFSGATGGTVFARSENIPSISTHRRWQHAEVRFGELRNQGEVKARANVIVSGNTTGAAGGDTSRGLAALQKQVRLAWFGHDVPEQAGAKVHLKPSDVVPMDFHVLGSGGSPLSLNLPLRTLRITFPALPPDGSPGAPKTYVRFDGFFGVQLSDPYHLWKFLRDLRRIRAPMALPVASADDTTTVSVYGAYGTFTPSPAPNGATTVFTIPFAYIDGTSQLYRNTGSGNVALTPGTDYTESDPASGEFTLATAPDTGDTLYVTCRVAGSV